MEMRCEEKVRSLVKDMLSSKPMSRLDMMDVISSQIGCSPRTVDRHLRNMLERGMLVRKYTHKMFPSVGFVRSQGTKTYARKLLVYGLPAKGNGYWDGVLVSRERFYDRVSNVRRSLESSPKTRAQLCEEFDCPRTTMHDALKKLSDRGDLAWLDVDNGRQGRARRYFGLKQKDDDDDGYWGKIIKD